MERNKRIYRIWAGMKQRCNNPKCRSARWYHDKGIRVCDQWAGNFYEFQQWAMENGYFDTASIDRIDPSKGYSPENCRWITLDENRRRANIKGVKRNATSYKINLDTTEGRILKLLNQISEAKGAEFTEGLVTGINMMAPRQPTREEAIAAIEHYISRMDTREVRLFAAFGRGLISGKEHNDHG